MYSEKILNSNLQIFEGPNVYDRTLICEMIANYKACLLKKKIFDFDEVLLAIPTVNVKSICTYLALIDLGVPFINLRYSSSLAFIDGAEKLVITNFNNETYKGIFAKSSYSVFQLNDDYEESKFNDLGRAKHEAKISYFSGGTTGEAAQYTHSISTILAAVENCASFYAEKNTTALIPNQNFNHFGLVTTTIFPSLMYCKNVVILNEKLEINKLPTIDVVTLAPHNAGLAKAYANIFSQNPHVLTGGVTISGKYLGEIFDNLPNASIFNIYGCTELTTPLMWNIIQNTASRFDDPAKLPFNIFANNLTFDVNEDGEIMRFHANPALHQENPSTCPDIIKYGNNRAIYHSRKWEVSLCKVKGSNFNVCISGDDVIKIGKQFFADCQLAVLSTCKKINDDAFATFIILATNQNKQNVTIEQINSAYKAQLAEKGFELEDANFKLVHDIFVVNLDEFNNGLKLDTKKLLSQYEMEHPT